jgi:hypothetical protein
MLLTSPRCLCGNLNTCLRLSRCPKVTKGIWNPQWLPWTKMNFVKLRFERSCCTDRDHDLSAHRAELSISIPPKEILFLKVASLQRIPLVKDNKQFGKLQQQEVLPAGPHGSLCPAPHLPSGIPSADFILCQWLTEDPNFHFPGGLVHPVSQVCR